MIQRLKQFIFVLITVASCLTIATERQLLLPHMQLENELHQACECGNMLTIQDLLSKTIAINAVDTKGLTALDKALIYCIKNNENFLVLNNFLYAGAQTQKMGAYFPYVVACSQQPLLIDTYKKEYPDKAFFVENIKTDEPTYLAHKVAALCAIGDTTTALRTFLHHSNLPLKHHFILSLCSTLLADHRMNTACFYKKGIIETAGSDRTPEKTLLEDYKNTYSVPHANQLPSLYSKKMSIGRLSLPQSTTQYAVDLWLSTPGTQTGSQCLQWSYKIYGPDNKRIALISGTYTLQHLNIDTVLVEENYAQKGLGSYLLEKMIALGTALQCQKITLKAQPSNPGDLTKLIEWYKKYNFKEDANTTFQKNYYNTAPMTKNLS